MNLSQTVFSKKQIILSTFILFTFFTSSLYSERAPMGLGYDEGIAGRYFFSDVMGLQANIAFESLGGWDGNGQDVEAETNFGLGLGFLYNLFNSSHVYLDALGQLAFAHDDTRDPNDVGDRGLLFIRAALAPEFLIGNHLGLGAKFGFELVRIGDTREEVTGGPDPTFADSDDARINMRFFGPKNPFDGAVLGLSLFVYFGGY